MAQEVLITIVEEGVLAPSGTAPNEWSFDGYMLSITKRRLDFGNSWIVAGACYSDKQGSLPSKNNKPRMSALGIGCTISGPTRQIFTYSIFETKFI